MNERGSAFAAAGAADIGWGLLLVLGALFVAHACNRYVASIRAALDAEAGQVEAFEEAAHGE